MNVGLRRHLRQVRDAEDLVLRGDAAQASTEGLPRPPAESRINLIKDQGARFACVAECLLNGERDATQLTARGDLGNGSGWLARIRGKHERDVVSAPLINGAWHPLNEWIAICAAAGRKRDREA